MVLIRRENRGRSAGMSLSNDLDVCLYEECLVSMHFSSGINRPPYESTTPMATMKKPAIMYRPAMEGFLQADRSNLTGSKKVAYNRR